MDSVLICPPTLFIELHIFLFFLLSHFIEDWVKIGMNAKKKVQRENSLLPFDDQCTVLEKVQLQTFHFLLKQNCE
jgi:hypothetical protein